METSSSKKLVEKLYLYLEKARAIESAMQLCEWDQETYMPHDGIFFRSNVTSALSEIYHKMMTSSGYKKMLQGLIDLESGEIKDANLDTITCLNLKVLREDFLRSSKLPVSFVKNFSKLCSESIYNWQKAKEHTDFKHFLPYLKKIVAGNQKKANYLGFTHHPYDALLDLYEPGMTVQVLDELFTKLKFHLIQLLKEIKAKNKAVKNFDLRSSFHNQMHSGRKIMEMIGLKPEFSRLDTTSHPFCTSLGPHDIRLTTRIMDEDFTSSLYSVLHEAGHGLYANGVNKKALGLPVGSSCSLGIDESQSRLYETILGKSKAFIEAILPKLKEELKLPHLELNSLFEHINTVAPNFIRIESDEISYCLHIILRYEIEKALIEGSLKVEKVPSVWNEKMEEYFGIIPSHDSLGCLQDIHWSMGAIGYFPTYALGNIYAASIMETYCKNNPQFEHSLQKGDLSSLQSFLQKNIYDHGRSLKPLEIIKNITAQGLNEGPYLRYLDAKFRPIYGI
jgi:carboxypeptidase Taq